jgi:erythromycin esterase-like protein
MPTSDTALADRIRAAAHPLRGERDDYDALLEMVGDARLVLLGEASHGTHEFYRERARITRRLIEEKGFTAIAVEADWPDAYRVNRYVRGASDDADADEALSGFKRFPTWMWRNTDVVELTEWMAGYNAALPADRPRVGFYGMDLYSLFTSIDAVIEYLDDVDPQAAQRARFRYACFEHFGEDTQAYGYAAEFGLTQPCEDQAVQQLLELQRRAAELASHDGRIPEDEFFFAEQNARLVINAEEYYRTMFRGRVSSWNLRDQHMVETLAALLEYFEGKGIQAKLVVWAHNSHLGDARATELGEAGEWNVGQLVRQRWGDHEALLVGFTTHHGTVTAASEWDGPAERKRVRPGLAGSYETLFHGVGETSFLLPLRGAEIAEPLRPSRLERAIGVIYMPQTERLSHYFHASLPEQFDAVIHWDETRAVHPLERTPEWESAEPPETYPAGI